MLVRREMRLLSPPHPVDIDRIISLPTWVSSAPHRNTCDRSVPGSLCCAMPLARRNSLNRLNSSKTLRKTASVAWKSRRQNRSAPRSCLSSAILFFHVGAVIVVSPYLFRRRRQTGHQHSKSVLGQIDQFLSHRWFGIANLFAYGHEPSCLIPAHQFDLTLAHRVGLVQSSPV